MKYLSFTIALGALVLLGAGCGSQIACHYETPWDSCVDSDGIDEALLGTWTLKGQAVQAPNGHVLDNPFTGRTLTFGHAMVDVEDDHGNFISTNVGSYVEDYSTERVDDQTAEGVTSSCDVLGTLAGQWRTDFVPVPVDPNDPNTAYEIEWVLQVTPGGGTPTVKCQADGTPVKSNQASTPLGVGVADSNYLGPYVEYDYQVSNDRTLLLIEQVNQFTGAVNVYTFVK